MISFKIFYTEAKQVGILYHYTGIFSLPRIIFENKLGTEHVNYISFTRDKHFHKYDRHGIIADECRIVIDGDKLSNNYKIKPYNYFGDQSKEGIGPYLSRKPHHKIFDEQEERVNKSITDIKQYIIKIQLFKKILDHIFSTAMTRKFDTGNGFIYFNSSEKFLDYLRQHCPVELI